MVKKPKWYFGDKMGHACHTTCWHSWPSLGGRKWHKPHAREVCEGGKHSSFFWDDTSYIMLHLNTPLITESWHIKVLDAKSME